MAKILGVTKLCEHNNLTHGYQRRQKRLLGCVQLHNGQFDYRLVQRDQSRNEIRSRFERRTKDFQKRSRYKRKIASSTQRARAISFTNRLFSHSSFPSTPHFKDRKGLRVQTQNDSAGGYARWKIALQNCLL
jgi:hypothetical protein